MNIFRQHINDYMTCPYLFAKNILANKYGVNKKDGSYKKFKDYITDIASYEMKNNTKLTLSEYRIGYTNKFYTTKKDVIDIEFNGLISKLNNIFSIFSENIFIGYNFPLEIVIPGTSHIYKDTISYVMNSIDSDKIVAIEIEDLSNINLYKRKLKNWPQYFLPYSYLAYKLNKKVELVILDPILNEKIEIIFLKDRFKEDILVMNEIIIPIDKNILYRNLAFCEHCNLLGC